MGPNEQNTTARNVLAAYDAVVARGASGELGERAAAMRELFQRRTGVFHADDPWFEARSRAFWDDALTMQGFAALAGDGSFGRAHRGFFLVDHIDEGGAALLDVWSGAELLVGLLDEAQTLALRHAEGAMDARVVAAGDPVALFVLPGAYHHLPDALEPAIDVLAGARDRGLDTGDTLDALLRMDLVYRSSSRVKASFAYRVEALPRPR